MIYTCITKKHILNSMFYIKVKDSEFKKAYLGISGHYNSVERVDEDYWVFNAITLKDAVHATSRLDEIGVEYEAS